MTNRITKVLDSIRHRLDEISDKVNQVEEVLNLYIQQDAFNVYYLIIQEEAVTTVIAEARGYSPKIHETTRDVYTLAGCAVITLGAQNWYCRDNLPVDGNADLLEEEERSFILTSNETDSARLVRDLHNMPLHIEIGEYCNLDKVREELGSTDNYILVSALRNSVFDMALQSACCDYYHSPEGGDLEDLL